MMQNSQIALNHKVSEVVDCNNVVNCPATEATSIVTTEPGEQCAPTQVEANLSGFNTGQTSTTDSDEHGELCPPMHVEPKVDASVNLAQSSTTETAGKQCTPTHIETESPPEDSTCCIKTPVSILSINLKLHYYEFNDWLKTI